MKQILTVILCAMFTISSASAQETKSKSKKETTKFLIKNMHCDNCIKKIEKNISFEKGVTDLKCDLKTHTAEVTYRSDKTTDEKLIAAFAKIDMQAKVLKEGELSEIKHDGHDH
ncbi:MAG: heavy-metal-associated domain-containing protein [Tannerella sp.]|jgi:Cu2+-exporting ATPase|nr:heavy-metal-associated domain-containing protein [Tannerella sp.]